MQRRRGIPECRAAHGHHHADHRRPGQAGRQHDHGVGAGGTRPVPRPSTGGMRRRDAGGTEAARWRQIPAARPGAHTIAGASDRPPKRVFPGSRPKVRAGALPRLGTRNSEPTRMPESRDCFEKNTWINCFRTRYVNGPRWTAVPCGMQRRWNAGCNSTWTESVPDLDRRAPVRPGFSAYLPRAGCRRQDPNHSRNRNPHPAAPPRRSAGCPTSCSPNTRPLHW